MANEADFERTLLQQKSEELSFEDTSTPDDKTPSTVEEIYNDLLLKSAPHREGCGKYQIMIYFIMLNATTVFSWILFDFAFLELMPQFNCQLDPNSPVITQDCSREQICQGSNQAVIPYSVDYSNKTSLHNWVEQLDLVCVSDTKIGLIGSMFFAGWASTCLVLPPLADIYGRKWVFILSSATMAIAMNLMTFVSRSIDFTIALVFLAGMATSGLVSMGYCYTQEFFTPKYKILFGFSYNSYEGVVYIFQTVYFAYLYD